MKRFLIPVFCSALFFFSCRGESKAPDPAKPQQSADSLRYAFRLLEFDVDGKPCSASINTEFKAFTQKKRFPLSVFITVSTIDKDLNGHPSEKEADIFYSITQEIRSELNTTAICFIGTTMMNGYRDIMIYASLNDQEKISAILKTIQQKSPRIKSFVFENDPEWEAVADFYNAL